MLPWVIRSTSRGSSENFGAVRFWDMMGAAEQPTIFHIRRWRGIFFSGPFARRPGLADARCKSGSLHSNVGYASSSGGAKDRSPRRKPSGKAGCERLAPERGVRRFGQRSFRPVSGLGLERGEFDYNSFSPENPLQDRTRRDFACCGRATELCAKCHSRNRCGSSAGARATG